ncbi:hypothetical protein [Arthrobacter sp. ISL-5]|nr:hypothetical protein [Arthrobacter sp. ISL-5]
MDTKSEVLTLPGSDVDRASFASFGDPESSDRFVREVLTKGRGR